jgi:DNA (cytosine-5)-methyltransferase 1
VAQPVVDFWRGERVSFARARPLSDDDPALVAALRRSASRAGDRPTAIDLFCGAGGLSLGLELAGFKVLMGADNDAASCETHARAFKGATVQADLSRPLPLLLALRSAGVRHVDLVAGGPPCQPFSRAGRSKIRSLEREGGRPPDMRPHLWLAFLRFVSALSPDLVLIENVADMVLWDGGQTIRQVCGSLEHRGYEVRAEVLDCWRYGVPQHRKRLFVLASRTPVRWPRPDDSYPTLRDAIGDLPRVGPAHRSYWIERNGGPDTAIQRRLRGRSARVSDHITRDVRPDDRRAFRLMRRGKRYQDLPEELRRYRSDIFDDKYHVLDWDELSRSITAHIAKDGYWYIHPEGERMLSIREAARLQTFPDRFRFAGYPSDRLRQIGNAVPVEIARRLGRSMVAAMQGAATDDLPFRGAEFRRRLLAWHRRQSRDYPWRRSMDPWLVLSAEMLLRRTRADAVAKVWPDYWRRFPSPRHVVRKPDTFRQTLRPLGLRWRVENLIELAKVLVEEWGGTVPLAREDLVALPGVGDYVADAVRAFAAGERAVLVDANTARIAARVFGLPEEWTSLRNLNLRASVARLGGVRRPSPEVNLALLDLGGTVCVSSGPRCGDCPVRELCLYARGVRVQGRRASSAPARATGG